MSTIAPGEVFTLKSRMHPDSANELAGAIDSREKFLSFAKGIGHILGNAPDLVDNETFDMFMQNMDADNKTGTQPRDQYEYTDPAVRLGRTDRQLQVLASDAVEAEKIDILNLEKHGATELASTLGLGERIIVPEILHDYKGMLYPNQYKIGISSVQRDRRLYGEHGDFKLYAVFPDSMKAVFGRVIGIEENVTHFETNSCTTVSYMEMLALVGITDKKTEGIGVVSDFYPGNMYASEALQYLNGQAQER